MNTRKDNLIIERYIRIVLNSFGKVLINGKNYNFKCNICGDGNKKSNKRGHIRYEPTEGFFYYKCFNYGCECNEKSWPIERWLKYTSKNLYNDYIKEKFENESIESIEQKLKITRLKNVKEIKTESKIEGLYKLKNQEKFNDSLFIRAREYCESRLIPEYIWENWYISTKGKYQKRIIIPFYNKENKIYYFQARSFTKLKPKYLNKVKGKDKAIYNIYNINKDNPVIIFEGIIDSLMVENSIAIIGVSISKNAKDIIDTLNKRWLFDNDKTGNNKAIEYLKNGEYVFLWEDFLTDFNLKNKKIKDMNEVCISLNKKERFKYIELEKYFTNNFYDKFKFNDI